MRFYKTKIWGDIMSIVWRDEKDVTSITKENNIERTAHVWTVKETSDRLGVNLNTLKKWIERRVLVEGLDFRRSGSTILFDSEHITRFIAKRNAGK